MHKINFYRHLKAWLFVRRQKNTKQEIAAQTVSRRVIPRWLAGLSMEACFSYKLECMAQELSITVLELTI